MFGVSPSEAAAMVASKKGILATIQKKAGIQTTRELAILEKGS
jgi:hypothetical protein